MLPVDVVVMVGQSNAQIAVSQSFYETINGSNYWGTLLELSCVEAGLNLGITVMPVGKAGDQNTSASGTTFAGTPLLNHSQNYNGPTWYTYNNIQDDSQGVTYGILEVYFAQYMDSWVKNNLTQKSLHANRVALLSMHNEKDEFDSYQNDTYGRQDWMQAKRLQRQDVANSFGLPTSSVPLTFWWVPYNLSIQGGADQATAYKNAANEQSGGANAIGYTPEQYNLHASMQAVIGNPQENMFWAGNFGDASMRGDGSTGTTGVNGDQHYLTSTADGPSDFQPGGVSASFVKRLANHISNLFAADAQPGSLVANQGHMDRGPTAASAALVPDGTKTHVVVSFNMDSLAPNFSSLGSGIGWSINNPGTIDRPPAPQAFNYAVGANAVSGTTNQIELTFANPIISGLRIYYEGLGDGHIAYTDYYDSYTKPYNPGYTEANGQGSAVYDSQGMPILVSPFGLVISGS